MVSTVTVQGSNGTAVRLNFDSTSNFVLAQQIAQRINAELSTGGAVLGYDTGDPPPTRPNHVTGVYVQTQDTIAVLSAAWPTDLVTKPGTALVADPGVKGVTVLSDAGTDLTFLAATGSGTVVAGGGDNRLVVGGHDNWSLFTGGGNDIISALDKVSATIGAGGGDNAIVLGNGKDLVISTGDDSITGGSGSETVDASGAQADFVQGNDSRLLFVGGLGGATILGGTGSDTYFGAIGRHTGAQVIVGGSAGDNYLFAGDGAATLVGGGDKDQLFAYGSSNQLLVAGSGNETLSAAFANGNDTLKAGAGHDLLIGGNGADTFVGGSGQTTVMAGSGPQTFAFINHQGGGSELVQGIFDPAAVRISLQGFDPCAVDQALASQSVKHGSVTIGLTDGTKVTFQDVTALTLANFT